MLQLRFPAPPEFTIKTGLCRSGVVAISCCLLLKTFHTKSCWHAARPTHT